MVCGKVNYTNLSRYSDLSERTVTDGHTSYPRAISEVLGESVEHRVSKSVHNPVEQSHRKLKQRYYPTMGFSNVETAGYFCEAVEELNQFLRVRRRFRPGWANSEA